MAAAAAAALAAWRRGEKREKRHGYRKMAATISLNNGISDQRIGANGENSGVMA
jgi:hypothetical protein